MAILKLCWNIPGKSRIRIEVIRLCILGHKPAEAGELPQALELRAEFQARQGDLDSKRKKNKARWNSSTWGIEAGTPGVQDQPQLQELVQGQP